MIYFTLFCVVFGSVGMGISVARGNIRIALFNFALVTLNAASILAQVLSK